MQREQARLEGERGELIGSRAAASSKAGEIKLQILQIREEVLSQTLLDLREADGRIAELSERKLAARARLDRMVVKAPITGTVYQLMVHTEGGVITPAEPLMMIVPEGDDLVLAGAGDAAEYRADHRGPEGECPVPGLQLPHHAGSAGRSVQRVGRCVAHECRYAPVL